MLGLGPPPGAHTAPAADPDKLLKIGVTPFQSGRSFGRLHRRSSPRQSPAGKTYLPFWLTRRRRRPGAPPKDAGSARIASMSQARAASRSWASFVSIRRRRTRSSWAGRRGSSSGLLSDTDHTLARAPVGARPPSDSPACREPDLLPGHSDGKVRRPTARSRRLATHAGSALRSLVPKRRPRPR